MNKLKLSKKKIIIMSVVCAIIATMVFLIVYNTPRWNGECELSASEYKFRGDTYTYVTMETKAYNFELDKKIAHSGGISLGSDFYTMKNDANRDFLYVSCFGERFVYTKTNINTKDLENPNCPYRKIISPKYDSD